MRKYAVKPMKILLVYLICIFTSSYAQTEEAKLKKAEVSFESHKFKLAIKFSDEILEHNNTCSKAYSIKGQALYLLGEYQKALDTYNLGIKNAPNFFVEGYVARCMILSELSLYKEAIESCDIALKYNYRTPEAYLNKASVLIELKQYNQAYKNLDTALLYNPNLPEAYLNKGIILSKQKKYKDALEMYNKALDIAPKYTNALYGKVDSLVNLKRFTEAGEVYAQLWNDKTIDEYKKYTEEDEKEKKEKITPNSVLSN